MKAGESGKNEVKSASEYHPAVREQVAALPDEKLRQLAKAHGIEDKEYDFNKRDERRHRTDRDRLAEEITAQMGDDEKINIGRNAEKLPQNAAMANKTKAERAASLFPRLRGPVDEYGNAAVAGGAPDSTGHSYAYTKSGDLHQVTARDSEGKTVAMVTATPEENDPRTWTVRHSASAEVGKSIGEKAYLRLVDAAQKEATRSGKPITLQGDTEMSPSAKRTWQKLETDRGLPVKWKASRPSIHFSPEEEEEVGADVTEEAPDFEKFRTQTMEKPGKKSPLKKM
jgi:hypothetical protein